MSFISFFCSPFLGNRSLKTLEVAVYKLLSLSSGSAHVAQLGDTGAGTLLTAFVTWFLGRLYQWGRGAKEV